MNKNEYLSRVFESQISSLNNTIKYTENDIGNLKEELREKELDLIQSQDLLKYAEEELRKLR